MADKLVVSAGIATPLTNPSNKFRSKWAATVSNILGNTLRVRIWHDPNPAATNPVISGTEVLNCAMAGPLAYNPSTGIITPNGLLSNVTIKQAANLGVGKAVMRITGNGEYVQGTLGLVGANPATNFTFPSNLTVAGGVAMASNISIGAPTTLPPTINDVGPVALGGIATNIIVQNLSASVANNQPISFGQVFMRGALSPSGIGLNLVNGSTVVPTQVDVKSLHADGTIKHCVISALIPTVAASTDMVFNLVRAAAPSGTPAVPSDFAGLDSVITLTIGGVAYTASLASLLTAGAPKWLEGPVVTEWEVNGPLKTAGNVAHPLLHARFHVRGYKGTGKVRVHAIVENTKIKRAAAPTSGQRGLVDLGMSSVTYDAVLTVGGTQVYAEAGVTHFAYARWMEEGWFGGATTLHTKLNVPYLIGTCVTPNYDTALTVNPTAISTSVTSLAAKSKLMDGALIYPYMPGTGGREDIGLFPAWDVRTLLSQHKDALAVTKKTASRSGSYDAHYRDVDLDRPLTLVEAPRMGLVWGGGLGSGDLIDPVTGINWMPYPVAGTPPAGTFDTAHTPECSYMAYLLTGDLYYAEQVEFWVNKHIFHRNPGYRTSKALVGPSDSQIRGQAWGLRTIAHAAYILPDSCPRKAFYNASVQDNIDWYTTTYITNSAQRPWTMNLGFLLPDEGSLGYRDGAGYVNLDNPTNEFTGIASWQDDHFTSVMGRLLELGFDNARPLFLMKAKFVIKRLTSGPDFCYQFASKYAFGVRLNSNQGNRMCATMAEVYQATVPTNLRALTCGTQAMTDGIKAYMGAPETFVAGRFMPDGGDDAQGVTNTMQPAAAYAATYGAAGGSDAWLVYSSTPGYRPNNITSQPTYTINPRPQ